MVAIVALSQGLSLPYVANIRPVLHIRLLLPSYPKVFRFIFPLWIPLNALIGRSAHTDGTTSPPHFPAVTTPFSLLRHDCYHCASAVSFIRRTAPLPSTYPLAYNPSENSYQNTPFMPTDVKHEYSFDGFATGSTMIFAELDISQSASLALVSFRGQSRNPPTTPTAVLPSMLNYMLSLTNMIASTCGLFLTRSVEPRTPCGAAIGAVLPASPTTENG